MDDSTPDCPIVFSGPPAIVEHIIKNLTIRTNKDILLNK